MRSSPAVGESIQPKIESKVVFPEPEGPSRAQASPRLRERQTSFKTSSASGPAP